MLNIFLFLSIAFLFTLIFGKLVEKIKVPWFFSALIFGFLLAIYNPFSEITSSQNFNFLAKMGMYLLLFMIGLEIDLSKFKKASFFIFKSTFFIILSESALGSLLIYFIFHCDLLISIIVATSFATVGEAILLPILDEFKIINTKLGQAIIGIGSLDDIIELIILMVVIFITGTTTYAHPYFNIILTFLMLFVLFGLTFGISKFKLQGKKFNHWHVETLFLFSFFILFFYLGIGEYSHAAPIAALLAGIAIKTFLPNQSLMAIENEIRAISYGFFTPIFFIWVGVSMNIQSLLKFPLFIILIIVVSSLAKYIGVYISAGKELGFKQSTLLWTGLSVRFSTSIIIIKILFENNMIDDNLYSIIIASSVIFTFAVPLLFSYLLNKWNINKNYD